MCTDAAKARGDMPNPPPEAKASVWANTEENIPKQNEAFAATSAAKLHNTEQRVAFPPGFDGNLSEGKWKKADNRQTWLIQDAHAAANALTVLHDDKRLYRLEKAQEAELLAASGDNGTSESDALPPRAVAVTTLVHTNLRNRLMLLDAAAFLARVAPPEELKARCARTVRMSLLAGQAARTYGLNAQKNALSTRYDPKLTSQVCVSWIEERPDGVDGDSARTTTHRIRSEFCGIKYAETALDYFNALRTAIVSTLMECEVAVEGSTASLHSINGTRHLFTSMDADPKAVSGAYEAGVVETSEEFWKLLIHTTPARLSPALDGRVPDEFLCFDEEKIFLKLAPRGRELNHPEVFHGLLLYKKGMHRETHDYCVDAMNEERKPQPNRHPNAPWGLRPPESGAAEELWLHVLSIHAEIIPLCEVVSGYGLEAVPGKRLVKDQPHCAMPRLVYRLQACDERFLSTTFALPCDQELCNPREEAVRLPLWATTEQAIVSYLSLFPPDYDGPWKEDEDGNMRKTLPFRLTKHIAPPTEEDALLRSLLGMPFGVEAFRLGDLHAEVERLRYCPHLAAFLVAAIHELGPDASIAQAFNDLTKLCQTHRSEVATLHKQITQLKGEAETANNSAESARKRLKVAVEEAVAETKEAVAQEATAAAEEPLELMACNIEQAGVLLRGVGLTPADGWELKKPLKGGRIVAIVRAYARATGLEIADEVANWSKKNATGEHFTALDTVTRTLVSAMSQVKDGKRAILLVQVRGEVYFYELDWIDGEFSQDALSPVSALSPERANLAWLLWNEDDSTITPLVKIQ